MNVNNTVVRTFSITDITEDQARDLLRVSANEHEHYEDDLQETLNNLRQALLNAGVSKGANNETNT